MPKAKKQLKARKALAEAVEERLREELSPLEERFCDEYDFDRNGSAAYKRTRPGVRDNTARTEACRLLKLPRVQSRLAHLNAERVRRTQLTRDMILAEMKEVAFLPVHVGFLEPRILSAKTRTLKELLYYIRETDPQGKDRPTSFVDLVKRAASHKKG